MTKAVIELRIKLPCTLCAWLFRRGLQSRRRLRLRCACVERYPYTMKFCRHAAVISFWTLYFRPHLIFIQWKRAYNLTIRTRQDDVLSHFGLHYYAVLIFLLRSSLQVCCTWKPRHDVTVETWLKQICAQMRFTCQFCSLAYVFPYPHFVCTFFEHFSFMKLLILLPHGL